MNSRLKPDAPELLALKKQLSIDTSVDLYKLAEWIRDNENWLSQAFACEGVTAPGQPDHYDEIYAWTRLEFKRYLAARTSQLAPIIPTESSCCASSSVAEPAETLRSHLPQMLQRLWRKSP